MTLDLNEYPVVVVDDEQDNLDAFRFNFRKTFTVLTANSGAEALDLLAAHDVAVVVSDQRMPKMTGLELLKQVQAARPDVVGMILTAFTDVDVLIEAINLGRIYRYITKPWDAKELRGMLVQGIERFRLLRDNRRMQDQLAQYTGYLNEQIHGAFDFGNIIGNSSALRDVFDKVEQVAPTASTVLLRGETGTGKELVAHAIHINSSRELKPFVRVNCAALAPGVLESELFGHEQGAFTGATEKRSGRFELADGGTLFLDEVGDLPMAVQIKLLRVLQEQQFERVGGTKVLSVDVRVVSATNRDLEAMIESGEFREDLYYRLNVFPLTLPPLRERVSDVQPLLEHFLAKYSRRTGKLAASYSVEALKKLQSYSWPGNVRELENVIERALIVVRGSRVEASHFEFARRVPQAGGMRVGAGGTSADKPVTFDDAAKKTLDERLLDSEKREIISAIERSQGNIAQAARLLGINRSTLYYRMRKHGLGHLRPPHSTRMIVGGAAVDNSEGLE